MYIIKTQHVSNASGRSQVKATCAGKQRTVSWDHSKSNDWNHGNAAGTLALVLFQGPKSREIAARIATHEHTDNADIHLFKVSI